MYVCVCVGVCIKSRVNVQFLLPQIELNRFLNVLPGPQSHSISATLTCTLCLCRGHNGNNNSNNNDISCHICLRLSHPRMIRHVCMCLPWSSPYPSLSLLLSLFLSLGKVSGTILLTCHFRSTDFEWKTRTSRNLHGPLADDRSKGLKGVQRDRGRGGKVNAIIQHVCNL